MPTTPARNLPLNRRVALLLTTTALAAGLAWTPPAQAQGQAAATVADTGKRLGGARGTEFFVLLAVDGRTTAQDALRANEKSREEVVLPTTLTVVERAVPAGRQRLKLRGEKFDASPVAGFRALLSRGKTEAQAVEGEVEVDLQPGQRYRVAGAIDNFRRQVWLEDAQGRTVSAVLNATLSAEQEAAMQGAQYLCCNLRYDGDWVAEGAPLDMPFVPAGTRIKILDIDKAHAVVLAEGRRLRLGKEDGNPEAMSLVLGRLLLAKPPAQAAFANWSAEEQRTVGLGRVTVGMTRAQAEAALGRPPRALNPAGLSGNDWRYALSTGEAVYLQFNAEGRVAGVDASRLGRSYTLREQVVLPPEGGAPAASTSSAAPAVPAAAAEPRNPAVEVHPVRPAGGASTPATAGAPR